MAIERKPGRQCGEVIGFPNGCAGLASDPLEHCRAMLRGKSCLLCVKSGDTALPTEITDRGWNIVGKRSVQAIKSTRFAGRWVVAVFIGGRMIDPRYPPIVCNERQEAIDLAFARARQIEPRGGIEAGRGDGEWTVGRVNVWTCEPSG